METYRKISVLSLVILLASCASSRLYLPESKVDLVEVPGGFSARMWGDELPRDVEERVEILAEQFGGRYDTDIFINPPTYLALSGGGSRGAFGAGLLKGWSESGTRPEMFIVSGISTGALIAPFAFLGPEYDDELEMFYTSISTEDLVARRSFLRGLFSDSFYDTRRLKSMLRNTVDRLMIADIAAEYRRGRRLFIGTTNLEARRPVIWNIGAIADVGTPEADQLIRDVMLASASIPGVFPPVRIKVSHNGEVFEEIHADGGVSNQVFLFPLQVDYQKARETIGVSKEHVVYVIRNGYLDPRWGQVELKFTSIVASSLDTVIRTQGIGDLYRIYLGAVRDGAQFRLAHISTEFQHTSTELFDPVYMRALFDYGYERARNGYPWESAPPGVEAELLDP